MSLLNGIGTEEHWNSDQWNSALRRGGINDDGQRGRLLASISTGIEEVWKRYAPASAGKRPALMALPEPLRQDLAAYEGSMFNVGVTKVIVATRQWLTNMSALPTDKEVCLTGSKDQIYQQGNLLELMTLGGVEEADHTLYRLQGLPRTPRPASELQGTLADYDAIPVEFRALERQLEIAVALSMPEVTVRLLRQRIENARRIMQMIG